jgi:hypothetical protein
MTRIGKIARLPREIRAQLNRRLQDGETGRKLLPWLNALPEVEAVLAREFDGSPVSEQNLSQWKQGGYREWLAQQEMLAGVRELTGDAQELSEAARGRLADHLATVVAAQFANAMAGWDGEVTDDLRRKLRILQGLCRDVAELRRGDHSAGRLKIEQERLEREREQTEEEVVEYFRRWAKNPDVRHMLRQPPLTPEERERRMREIFGLAPKNTEPPPSDPASETDPGAEKSN